MTAEAGRDWRIEEEEPEPESGAAVEERLARTGRATTEDFLASVGDDDEDEEETDDEQEADSAGADAALVLGFADDYAAQRASADADSAAFRAQLEENLPGYQPTPEEPTEMERAAIAASKFPPGSPEFEALKTRMADANDDLRRKARAGSDGFDTSGEPVVEPFDPSGLDSAGFNMFMRAVASGGANPRETPAGETRESWAKKVASAIGGGQ